MKRKDFQSLKEGVYEAGIISLKEENRRLREALVKIKGDIEKHRVWTGQEYHQHPVPVYRTKKMLRRIDKVLKEEDNG